MPVDPELLEVIACPKDHAGLHYRRADEILVCSHCATEYPVRQGIPVLLVEEGSSGQVEISQR